MAHLYRFTCKPNYPVCEAELLFLTDSVDEQVAFKRLQELLEWRGYSFAYPETERTLTYLGEFYPHLEFKDGVITYQNGEY